MAQKQKPVDSEEHLGRVRRICSALPETTEKLSHGEPTFFVRKKVFAMFANNHHSDGHIAVWIPAAPGFQTMLIHTWPENSSARRMSVSAAGSASNLRVSMTMSWLLIYEKRGA